jgi:hypothetical protein
MTDPQTKMASSGQIAKSSPNSTRRLEGAASGVVAAVEVVGVRDAGLLRRLREGLADVPAQPLLLDAPLAAVACSAAIAAAVSAGLRCVSDAARIMRVTIPLDELTLETIDGQDRSRQDTCPPQDPHRGARLG